MPKHVNIGNLRLVSQISGIGKLMGLRSAVNQHHSKLSGEAAARGINMDAKPFSVPTADELDAEPGLNIGSLIEWVESVVLPAEQRTLLPKASPEDPDKWQYANVDSASEWKSFDAFKSLHATLLARFG